MVVASLRSKVINAWNETTSRIPRIAQRRLLKRYRAFLLDQVNKPDDLNLLRQAMSASAGLALDKAATLAIERYASKSRPSDDEAHELLANVERLKSEGFLASPSGIPQTTIQSFLKDAAFKLKESCGIDLENVDPSSTEWVLDSEMVSLPDEWVLSQPLTQTLICSPRVLAIASGYLGLEPVLTSVNSWFSFPSARSRDAGSAHQWHWDCDRVKWLKVFLYITDVDLHNGAHSFARGSHIVHRVKTFSSRVPNEAIRDVYDSADLVSIVGSQGTLIFEDTRGFHRGSPLDRGFRLVLQLEFALDKFGSRADTFGEIEELKPRLLSLPHAGRLLT